MQRDIGNEVIVTIVAIGVLAFAVAFAIILSLSSNPTAQPTLTPTIIATTEVLFVPEATIPLPTAIPTTLEPTDTPTEQPPSATPIPTQQPTTAAPTDTTQPPSATPVQPSRTPKVPTSTQIPTELPTQTPTLLPRSTNTNVPSRTPSPTLSPSPTASQTPVTTPSLTPTTNTPTLMPIETAAGNQKAEGCTDPSTQITHPIPRQVISGTLVLMGTAWLNDFWYYKIETRPDFATIYTIYNRSETTVINDVLGEVDTNIFSSGLYWIKLTVVNKDGLSPVSCAIPVIIK